MLKFISGILCGVGVGILIAPDSGERTRRQLMRVAREPEEVAREAVTSIREKAGDIGANMGRQAAQQAVDKVTPEKFSSTERRSG
jgi:gas vesicle protein